MPVSAQHSEYSFVPHAIVKVEQTSDWLPDVLSSNALVPAAPAISPEVSMQLLSTMFLFYQQRRGWVQRSRASLELAYVQGPLAVAPSIGAPSEDQSDSDGSAQSICSSGNTTNEPTPATTDSDGGMISDEAMVKQEEEEDSLQPRSRALVPFTLRATNAAQAPSSRWLKRKKSFKLHLGPLAPQRPTRPRRHTHMGGPEPGARLLELFGELLDARMESCIRVTRLVRDSNRSMLHT